MQDYYAFIRVNITLHDMIVCIRFENEDPSAPPYKIVNRTNYEIQYRQKEKKGKTNRYQLQRAYPEESLPFTWDSHENAN